MKKFSSIIETKKSEIQENELVFERNLYLDFSKKYNKEHGVSGPFDKKFKGDKDAQKDYMEGLSMAWEEYKKKKGIKTKASKNKFDFKKKMNESKANDLANQMVGDGGDPNYHFVTMNDDYCYLINNEITKYSKDSMNAPLKIKTTPDMGAYTFGPFMNLEEAKMFAESIELDELNGPRMVVIQDRANGDVYMKYLTCKMQPVWNEEVLEGSEEDDADLMDTEDDSDSSQMGEYTYGDETEDEEE